MIRGLAVVTVIVVRGKLADVTVTVVIGEA
jgi:hypothetical protein